MMRKVTSRIAFWALLVSLAAVLITVDKPALGADGPVKKIVKKERASRGRLPNYYSNVVSEEQREKILKIQEEYKPKIEALQAQIEALKKERDEKITSMLSEEQKKKVEEAKAKAKEKKETPPAKPAETPVAPPPAATPTK